MSFLQNVDYPTALHSRVWKKGPRNAKSKMHALMLLINRQPGGKRFAVSRQAIKGAVQIPQDLLSEYALRE